MRLKANSGAANRAENIGGISAQAQNCGMAL
jgi:hypothetical protein